MPAECSLLLDRAVHADTDADRITYTHAGANPNRYGEFPNPDSFADPDGINTHAHTNAYLN